MCGTASTIRNWILLEQPGPWGYRALVQSRLPSGVGEALAGIAGDLGIRTVLIRRPGGYGARERQCFFVHTGPGEPWLQRTVLSDPAELLALDLRPLAEGKRLGSTMSEDRPIHLVCTNGRRDPCCAERGRPLARALNASLGDRVWESSHIGGDRFAGNLTCFPGGHYFGRVSADHAVRVASAYEEGSLDLSLYRGRCCYGFAQQAAECFLRQEMNLRGVEDLQLVDTGERRNGELTARFRARTGSVFAVRLRASHANTPRPLTCHSGQSAHPRRFELLPPIEEE